MEWNSLPSTLFCDIKTLVAMCVDKLLLCMYRCIYMCIHKLVCSVSVAGICMCLCMYICRLQYVIHMQYYQHSNPSSYSCSL